MAQAGGGGLSGARAPAERFVGRGVPLTTASDAHRLSDVADRTGDLAGMLPPWVRSLRAFRARRGAGRGPRRDGAR